MNSNVLEQLETETRATLSAFRNEYDLLTRAVACETIDKRREELDGQADAVEEICDKLFDVIESIARYRLEFHKPRKNAVFSAPRVVRLPILKGGKTENN